MELANIIESTLVPHTNFELAIKTIEQGYKFSPFSSEPICLALVGESRTGKSRVLEEILHKHPKYRKPEGLYCPILRVNTPSKPTVKGLVELMLEAIEDPEFDKGSEIQKTSRLKRLMNECQTQMVMIDEFQHFYDKVSHKVMHYVADWLKLLVEDGITLVVSGLPSCLAVISQNEQLEGRFLRPIQLPRFDWRKKEHQEEFLGILESFRLSISRHYDIPNLSDVNLGMRIYCGCGGLIGLLAKFLRQAIWNAIDEYKSVIDLQDLSLAHRQSIWDRSVLKDYPSPFSNAFPKKITEDLQQKIMSLNTVTIFD